MSPVAKKRKSKTSKATVLTSSPYHQELLEKNHAESTKSTSTKVKNSKKFLAPLMLETK
jgi:hypothetical protein